MTKSHSFNDVEILLEMDSIMEELELETQKGISMTALHTPFNEAFAESWKKIDSLMDIQTSIEDYTIKLIALSKVKEAIDLFEETIAQVN